MLEARTDRLERTANYYQGLSRQYGHYISFV